MWDLWANICSIICIYRHWRNTILVLTKPRRPMPLNFTSMGLYIQYKTLFFYIWYMYISIYIYVCIDLYIYVCVYIYIYKQYIYIYIYVLVWWYQWMINRPFESCNPLKPCSVFRKNYAPSMHLDSWLVAWAIPKRNSRDNHAMVLTCFTMF